ncbi:hypothetical protein C3K47_07580 [Solitalea longa]|uniref:Uncharacterized protein n=1 Tax=Solitalea longa TaxID=2079460 RepID=A0A2S5A2X6_9SPHI|nr:hypothetical protein [Solitalea longa]POY36916.1 hypothetical protein C3K47_07580 [Solitalea longa]
MELNVETKALNLKIKAQREKIPSISQLTKASSIYEISEESIDEHSENRFYRKEIILPALLMIITLIVGKYTGISIPELVMISIGCIWYIVSCYKVFRENEK